MYLLYPMARIFGAADGKLCATNRHQPVPLSCRDMGRGEDRTHLEQEDQFFAEHASDVLAI